MILLELIAWIIFFFLLSSPVWINGNWKTIFDKDLNRYYRNMEKNKRKVKSNTKLVCTQNQPLYKPSSLKSSKSRMNISDPIPQIIS